MNAENFEAAETLRRGLTVKVRAIRPADNVQLSKAFSRLDPESVHSRFFTYKPALSDQELKTATEVDFEDVVALVVTREAEGREVIAGGGRYMVIEPGSVQRSVEVAFLVEEDYHGLGIAGRILRHLAGIAREKGVSQFEAGVLPQNKAMLDVFSRSGLPMQQHFADGFVHVTLSLAEKPQPTTL